MTSQQKRTMYLGELASRRTPSQTRCQLNLAVDPALKERLALFAAKRGCFESRVVREALITYLNAKEK